MRCKHCNKTFKKRYPNQMGALRFCLETDECTAQFWQAVKEKRIKDAQKQKREKNLSLMSKDKYRATYIQPLINQICRLIDKDQPCIATGNFGKMSAGHRHSVGDSRHLSLNLHNVHVQSYHSNSAKGGDHVKYRQGIIKTYGREYADFIDETLIKCPQKLWNKTDLERIKPILRSTIKEIKSLNKVYTPKERIILRNQINKKLGIYSDFFCIFDV